ncbi:FAD-dependent oxidoreductase [Hyphobacterium sp.]|uniref:FAD-dependent oxidoreductase n=1 Tax=Hyphobacterium sp. TaxID=2004662 RepID=UPI003BAB9C5C
MESLAPDLRQMQRTPLHDRHVELIREAGEVRDLAARHVLVRPGEVLTHFYYLLEGEVEVVDARTDERALPNTLGPGQYAGDISFLSNSGAALMLRTAQATRVIAVERETMLRLMSQTPEMSDIIVTVFAARRRRILESGDSALTLIGTEMSRDLRQVEAFLSRNMVPHRRLTIEEGDQEGYAGPKGEPRLVHNGHERVEHPSAQNVARLLRLDQSLENTATVDVLIVGGGPSGVAAAVYAGAEGLSALVVDEIAIGGQAGTSSRIENYMGFPTGISGGDLIWRGEVQALKFGTQFAVPRRVIEVKKRGERDFAARLCDGTIIQARAVIIATGVQYRQLPLDRLSEFEGNGIYYAATESEARYCTGAEVAIIGGGNSAGQAAMYLCRKASHVHVLVRGASLAASMSDYLTNRLDADPDITVHYNTQVTALGGRDRLEAIDIHDGAKDETRMLSVCGLFIMVGAAPNTAWLPEAVEKDARGFVLTGQDVGNDSPFETSLGGVFAVGDVRAGSVKRVASAVGEGSVAISKVWDYVRSA